MTVVVAALVATFARLGGAAPALLQQGLRVEASLGDRVALRGDRDGHMRLIRVSKFSRLSPPSDDELRQARLTPDVILAHHQKQVALASVRAVKHSFEVAWSRAVATARAEADRIIAREPPVGGQALLLTALVENVSAREDTLGRVFDLVLPEATAQAVPETIPLPETRPELAVATVEEEDEPAGRRRATARKPKTEELAYAKPDRSLLDGLRGSKGGWPGRGTRVAIYDVAAATVHMPDGTKLRAHSGIGRMRDNPRYSHVKMNGPTPAGIYRLSMRETRFYGVEALRMTSIDGTDPKNRTGLLTHTNLLRGQIGSHGCVAFQNYAPFLKAFKRGHITMLVVVDRMPSSSTQIAAIYRKAGA
ncbi:DUF2778 domain-containing protein [Rhizobium sp. TRM95111]|uniref:DUF2778 domain-containing protein n=1 Tax=Rhizobium alarense TaxID=2846851 RepID=UPI001F465CDB|nr:DUF2778 domain-containing protein [Rhizobium alarense]MCF3640968.1 DUF2778 domain-containing protein [Rhizobium alarense]